MSGETGFLQTIHDRVLAPLGISTRSINHAPRYRFLETSDNDNDDNNVNDDNMVRETSITTAAPVLSKADADGNYGIAAEPAKDVRDDSSTSDGEAAAVAAGLEQLEARDVHWYSYLTTLDFWAVIAVGQILSLCITGTNTFTSFLSSVNTIIPAFQTLFNYALLVIIWLPITWYKMGVRRWCRLVWRDWWKYFILSFLDVEGNYFTVLAYDYTTILSAQLINFWSIVCVVIISFLLLRVRYRLLQIAGILICCGGMGLLLASDHITGANGGEAANALKGDLFALLGATMYGVSNVFEEWFVSKRPVYEVLSLMGIFGVLINGVQAAIFDRESFQGATWDGQVAGWLVGYTLCLNVFYGLAPLILRMGSAAVFDINLLTANFWGVIIGTRVFGLSVHWMYPIAFVLIICGLIIYFLAGSILGDSKKPWLGDNQKDGVAGIGTAKLKALNEARRRGLAAEGPEGQA